MRPKKCWLSDPWDYFIQCTPIHLRLIARLNPIFPAKKLKYYKGQNKIKLKIYCDLRFESSCELLDILLLFSYLLIVGFGLCCLQRENTVRKSQYSKKKLRENKFRMQITAMIFVEGTHCLILLI